MIKFDGDLESLTLPYYGFYETKLMKGKKVIKSYSNGLFSINGETREITFEESWLVCNNNPDIRVKDLLILTKMPIKITPTKIKINLPLYDYNKKALGETK